jgi:hypothetical protein
MAWELSWPGEVMSSSPFVIVQGASDPVSKSPLMRRFPVEVHAVEEGVAEELVSVVDVESSALVVAKGADDAVELTVLMVVNAVGEAAILVLVTE